MLGVTSLQAANVPPSRLELPSQLLTVTDLLSC